MGNSNKIFIICAVVLFITLLTETCRALTLSDRTIHIVGEINSNIIDKADELVRLSGVQEPVYIILNSSGGEINAGRLFIDAMELVKSRGIEVICLSTVVVASMAFSIYAHCSKRYAFPSALMMFHPPRRAAGTVTAPEARELAEQLTRAEKDITEELLESMGIDDEVFIQAYLSERLWKARELVEQVRKGWLILVTDVVGRDKLLYGNE